MDHDSQRTPFFYGWVMLGVAVLMSAATMPGQTVLMALFNTPIRESLGLSVEQISAAYAIGTILASLPLPLVGRAADRFGLRPTIAFVVAGFVASLLLLREATGIVSLGACFFGVRFLGQGSLGMLSRHSVAMWFERRLGRADAILSLGGFAGASALLPIPVAALIAAYGWQSALLVCAAGVLVLTVPSLIFVFRNKPEDIGQHLDGDPTEHATHDTLHGGAPPPGDPAFNARQAVGTRAFWTLAITLVMGGFIGTALLFHMQTILQQAGLEDTDKQAALAIQPWAICTGLATIAVGWLVDRHNPACLLPFSMGFMAISLACCAAAANGLAGPSATIPLMATGMGLLGVSHAMISGVCNPTIARFFGRTHHGSIRGFVATAIVMGTGGGPYLFALGHRHAGGDFVPVMILFACAAVPLGIAGGLLRRPAPPAHPDRIPEPDEPDAAGVAI